MRVIAAVPGRSRQAVTSTHARDGMLLGDKTMEMTGEELNRALRLVDWATSEEELANLDVSTTGWPEAHIALLQEAIDKHRQMLVAPPLE